MLVKAKMAESRDFEDGDLELSEDEAGLIRCYFFGGLQFLFKNHA